MDTLLQILELPITAVFLCLALGGLAVAGKFSRFGANILFFFAWVVGSLGILRSDAHHWQRETIAISSLGFAILGLSLWAKPKNKSTEETTTAPMPDLHGRIIRAFRDEDQQCYFLEIGLTNQSEASCTVAKYMLNVLDAEAAIGSIQLRGTMEEFTPVGNYSISSPPFQVQPLHIDDFHPLQRGIEQIGWVEFYVESAKARPADMASWEENFTLTVIDSLDNNHLIEEPSTSVHTALFHRGLKEDLNNLSP
ncbi:MAG TPA: hypothetical protein VFC39_17170 [Acidobacteriaceae bacterium]|nr:hypothetical protein [Acidobacteriaceae bacterium]